MQRVAVDIPCKTCHGSGYLGSLQSRFPQIEPCKGCQITGISYRLWRMVKRSNKKGTRAEIRARKQK